MQTSDFDSLMNNFAKIIITCKKIFFMLLILFFYVMILKFTLNKYLNKSSFWLRACQCQNFESIDEKTATISRNCIWLKKTPMFSEPRFSDVSLILNSFQETRNPFEKNKGYVLAPKNYWDFLRLLELAYISQWGKSHTYSSHMVWVYYV